MQVSQGSCIRYRWRTAGAPILGGDGGASGATVLLYDLLIFSVIYCYRVHIYVTFPTMAMSS